MENVRKERIMSEHLVEETQPKKKVSGIWVLAIFAILFGSVIVMGVLGQ